MPPDNTNHLDLMAYRENQKKNGTRRLKNQRKKSNTIL